MSCNLCKYINFFDDYLLGGKEFIGFPRLWEGPGMYLNCISFICRIVRAWLVLVWSNLMMFWHYVRATSRCYREHCL